MDCNAIARMVLEAMESDAGLLPSDFNELEAEVHERMDQIGAAVVEQRLARERLGYEGPARPCGCGRVQRFVGHRKKVVQTTLGDVRIERAYYRCAGCGANRRPYDERAGLGLSAVSEGLAKLACRCAAYDPFGESARLLEELTGRRLSPATVHRLAERVGQVAADRERAQAERMARWEEPPAQATPERLYVAVDGGMVHTEGSWHEAKVATCYWEDAEGRRTARHRVRFEDAAGFVGHVWALACRCGLEQAKEVVLLGDGADWIWKRIGPLPREATQVVDWYHAMEHVWACGRALHGEGTEASEAWVKEVEALLWEGKAPAIRRRLEAERARVRAPAKRRALEALATYLRRQEHRLDYARFRERGLDIGSGRVESAVGHVVGDRAKRSGMHWSTSGVQATLSLRTACLNDDWKQLWDQHPLAA